MSVNNGKKEKLPTPTERRILDKLNDGIWHRPAELIACIDEQADGTLLKAHLYNIRQKIRPNYDVATIHMGQETYYQLVHKVDLSE